MLGANHYIHYDEQYALRMNIFAEHLKIISIK